MPAAAAGVSWHTAHAGFIDVAADTGVDIEATKTGTEPDTQPRPQDQADQPSQPATQAEPRHTPRPVPRRTPVRYVTTDMSTVFKSAALSGLLPNARVVVDPFDADPGSCRGRRPRRWSTMTAVEALVGVARLIRPRR